MGARPGCDRHGPGSGTGGSRPGAAAPRSDGGLGEGLPAGVAGNDRPARSSDELSWLGDTGVGGNLEEGANSTSASVPDTISAVLGIAGDFFEVFLAGFTILFICLFFIADVENLKRALGSVLMPGERERWLNVWERVTESVSAGRSESS